MVKYSFEILDKYCKENNVTLLEDYSYGFMIKKVIKHVTNNALNIMYIYNYLAREKMHHRDLKVCQNISYYYISTEHKHLDHCKS